MISGCSLVHFLDPVSGFPDPCGGHVSTPRVWPGLAVQLVVQAARVTHRGPSLQKYEYFVNKLGEIKNKSQPCPVATARLRLFRSSSMRSGQASA